MGGTYHKLEWLRMVGDVVFFLAGALPITLGALRTIARGGVPKGSSIHDSQPEQCGGT
jgi:hypothetical protein